MTESASRKRKRLWRFEGVSVAREELPNHIAIIMDGNGRWARSRGLPRYRGHKEGSGAVERTVRYCAKLGINYLTLYAFSEQNWSRPKEEIDALFGMLREFINNRADEIIKNNIRVSMIGRIEKLPPNVRESVERIIDRSKENTGMKLCVALSYGGREEIVDMARSVAEAVREGRIESYLIDEDLLRAFMYDPDLPDVDLLIRTGGEIRISNFLLWYIPYAELYFTKTLWPDFSERDIDLAIEEFRKRERRFGGID